MNTEEIEQTSQDLKYKNMRTPSIGAINTYKKDELSLIDEIKKNSTLVKGKISTSPQDGVRYRYDRYVFKYPHALNYLVKKFESLAGRSKNINIGNFSIYYDRPKFAGSKNGSFMMTELVENI